MKIVTLIMALAVSVSAQNYTESIVYHFGSNVGDGNYPVAGLVMDAAGSLYGTAQQGGSYSGLCAGTGCGTVFKLSGGKETILHAFTAGSDGSAPNASLAIDKAGNLYGTTTFGGLGKGVVFKITAAGKYSILHTFGRTIGDGAYPLGPLAIDSVGTLYGVTSDTNTCTNFCPAIVDKGYGVVFSITSRNAYKVLYSFTGGQDGGFPSGNVILDAQQHLYGTTSFGGAFGGGTLWQMQRGVLTTLYSFCQQANCADGTGPSFIRRSSTGDFYLTLYSVNGNGNGGGIALVPATGPESVLFNFCKGVYSCAEGYGPQGATVLTGGTVYGTTEWGGSLGEGAVFQVSSAGETVLYSFAQTASDGSSPMGGVIQDAQGNLYGTTSGGGLFGGGTVWKLTKK